MPVDQGHDSRVMHDLAGPGSAGTRGQQLSKTYQDQSRILEDELSAWIVSGGNSP